MIKINGREIEFKSFPNGETKLIENDLDFAISQSVMQEISFKYQDDSDLIKLMMVKRYVDENTSKLISGEANLTIYYMPYSRMDRSESGSAFTLKYIADFINKLNFGKVTVIEPHSDVTPALLDNVEARYINFDLLPKVMEEVEFDKEEDFIVFPDAGASKRYHSMKDIKNVLIGHKHRDFQTGKITNFNLVGDFEGMGDKAIIVDDLSSYGGTFVHTAKALREEGFKEVYLLVAHAEWNIFRGELFKNVDKVFTTNSILDSREDTRIHMFDYDDMVDYDNYNLKIYNIEEVLKDWNTYTMAKGRSL